MNPLKQLLNVDGQFDLAKLVALIAHLSFAAAFLKFQVLGDAPFNEILWITYGGFAIGHDAFNRASAMMKDRSDRKIAAEANPAVVVAAATPTVSTTVSTTTTEVKQ